MNTNLDNQSNLPELVGSSKQVAWATEIRAKVIASVAAEWPAAMAKMPMTQAQREMMDGLLERAMHETSARKWIDFGGDRYMTRFAGRDLIKAFVSAEDIRTAQEAVK